MIRRGGSGAGGRLLAGVTVLAGVAAGCAPATVPPRESAAARSHDHDHGHHDEAGHDQKHEHGDHDTHDTLAAALAELETICANVKTELGKKNLDEADSHVHMVGHLVDDMHSLVGRSQLPDDAKAAAKKALDEVFDCFDTLDSALHSADDEVRKKIDYVEHEPRIQAAIDHLKQAAAAAEAGDAEAAPAADKPQAE